MLNKEKTITISLDEYNRLLESQKQVDELKAENTELYKEHTTLIAGSILQKEQAVKDTAKEIAKYLLINDEFGDCSYAVELIKERYGVEVE
jgi:predicted transcriptional regulator